MTAVKPPGVLSRIARAPFGLTGLLLVCLVVFGALFADWIVPYDPNALNLPDRMQAPSAAHWLGTDQLGRDTFSRIVMGGRVALQIALPATAIALVLGFLLGAAAGLGPRWLDAATVLLFDSVRSFPTVMLALAVVALAGPSIATVVLVIVATQFPVYGRVARAQTLALRESEFILAERAMGASTARIATLHILPNIAGSLLILASMDIPAVVALESGLSFLGLGVKPPTPSWGGILSEGFSLIRSAPWLVVAGGVALILTTLGFTFLGETLRDIFDPKLRAQ